MAALDMRDLGFRYDDGTEAIKGLTLSVAQGERVAVVGPNGAGKSTLLHLIAGFRMPFSGDLTVMGKRLDKNSADGLRRHMGLLFQDPDDQIFMPTVEEDVAFGPVNLGLEDIAGRVTRALRSTGTEHLAKRPPHRLSFGMRKRVAIAGILAMDPGILLLDEPTSGLDPRSRSQLIALLKGMRQTMVIATHDLEAAAELADRAVVLNVTPVAEGTIRHIVSDRAVLEGAGLEMPALPKLLGRLEEMGYPVESLPVTMEQALAEISRMVEREAERRSD
jgi:cobalt/nickel transport system ATP-binding protein